MPRSVVIFVFVFSLGSVRYIDDDEIEMVHRITIEKGQCLYCRSQLLNPLSGRLQDPPPPTLVATRTKFAFVTNRVKRRFGF